MGNHLREESSPYLLQHSENPVDWYPWCSEAFKKAENEGKPVFLSVGYSTCHWCHVMAHESFENKKTAELLNKYFISIKVDREERPDIDSVYMDFCQAFTGRGGWPMSIFMTSGQKPFFAGTYFPAESNYGMVGFNDLLMIVAKKWRDERESLIKTADEVVEGMRNQIDSKVTPASDLQENIIKKSNEEWGNIHAHTEDIIKGAANEFAQNFDSINGGFGGAPKFPTPHNLIFLMLYSWMYNDNNAFLQVKTTLDKMRRGGIFDHIGYGFSRYSTDAYYLVPHFEKMLYDNALLIISYAMAYKISGDNKFLETAEKTAKYIFREMTGGNGEFYSAQDADSEGKEGEFYCFGYDEIIGLFGAKKGKSFCDYFGITKQGNFEGKNIPNLLKTEEMTDEFEKEIKELYNYRKSRMKLHLDDKILTSWNALMICAMSVLYRVTGQHDYLSAAKRAAKFIEDNLTEDDCLFVSFRHGAKSVKGFLEEYSFYAWANISLYEVTSDEYYLKRAEELCAQAKSQFADEKNGGFYLYGEGNDTLVTRPKECYDGALPSGNSVMACCLVRLSQLTGNEEYKNQAIKQLSYLYEENKSNLMGCSVFLIAQIMSDNNPGKIVTVLPEEYIPDNVICQMPLLPEIKMQYGETEEYKLLNGKVTYYVCRDYNCFPPTNHLDIVKSVNGNNANNNWRII